MNEQGTADLPTTAAENDWDERLGWISEQLATGTPQFRLVPLICERFGCHRATAYRWSDRARAEMARALDRPTAELVCQQVMRLEKIIDAEGTSASAKIAAISELNKLLGLHQPTKVAFTDPQDRSVSLLEVVQGVEERRRAPVIDARWIDETMAALPDLTAGGGDPQHLSCD